MHVGYAMKFFHIDWLPEPCWGYQLVNRFHESSNPALKDRFKRYWPKQQMIAFATKRELIRVIQCQFNQEVAKLSEELAKKNAEIQQCLPEHRALRLADSELGFRLVAGIDAFIFESRSAYEILGAVVREIAGNILGKKVDQKLLREVLETKGHDTKWINDLHDERIGFFHQTAPWIAVAVTESKPPYEIRVLRRNPHDRECDVSAAFPLDMLNRIFFGFREAVAVIEGWLLEGIDQAERGAAS